MGVTICVGVTSRGKTIWRPYNILNFCVQNFYIFLQEELYIFHSRDLNRGSFRAVVVFAI